MQVNAIKQIKKLGFAWESADPFLFCVYHKDNFPRGQNNLGPEKSLLKGRALGSDFTLKDGWRMYHGETLPGFPAHPHRGFETITIVTQGCVDHHDSLGACGRFGDGDCQWMTAGRGLQHSEMFPLLNQEERNPMELFQIWINLPAKKKFAEPDFTMLWGETHPRLTSEDNQTRITVIADTSNLLVPKETKLRVPPNSWASFPDVEIGIWLVEMDSQASWSLPLSHEKVNRTLYFFEGEKLTLNEQSLDLLHCALLVPNAPVTVKNTSTTKSRFLILQGQPIGEPVAQRGPFVMNSQQELVQAQVDFMQTRFGGWPWKSDDPHMPREAKRFGKLANGQIEYPPSSTNNTNEGNIQ